MNKLLEILNIFALLVLIQSKQYFETKYGAIEFITELRKDKVDGKFSSSMLGEFSLNFKSRVSYGQTMLEISNAENNNVIISYNFNENAIGYMQIGKYVFVENTNENTAVYVSEMSSIPTQLNEGLDVEIHARMQQQSTDNVTKYLALSDLKTSYDMEMLEILSYALGEGAGISTRDYPSIMAIHIATHNLLEAGNEYDNASIGFGDRFRRGVNEGKCPNPRSKGCAKKPIGRSCLGLCGPGTTCWSWVCGDCCLHRGCLQHDKCCRSKGMLTLACLSVWKFTCNSYSC